jgi:predicted PurR-regulated permease PerM
MKQDPAESSAPSDTPKWPTPRVDIRNAGLTILAVSALVLMLRYAQDVVIPFVISGLMFYALDPMVGLLQRLKIPRVIGSGLVLVTLTGGVGAGIWALQPQAVAVLEQLPEAARRLRASIRRGPDPDSALTKVQEAAKEINQTAAEAAGAPAPPRQGVMRVQVEQPTFDVRMLLWTSSLGAAQIAGQILLLLFLTYFMLVSHDRFRRKLVRHAGDTLSRKKITVQILDEIDAQIRKYLQVQIFTSVVVGTVTSVTLWAMGLQQAAFWGLLAGLFNSIPYVGPLIVTGALAVVAFLQFNNITMAASIAGVALVITTLEGMILTPFLIGKASQMNHVAIFASLLFWSWMWGAIGMLLAVPMLMVFKAICDHIEGLAPVADFLAE